MLDSVNPVFQSTGPQVFCPISRAPSFFLYHPSPASQNNIVLPHPSIFKRTARTGPGYSYATEAMTSEATPSSSARTVILVVTPLLVL